MVVAVAVFGVSGLFSIAGGVLGFKKAGSRASLIAGSISGALLLGATFFILTGASTVGLIVGGVTSFLLAGRFIPAFVKTRQLMPQGIMSVLAGAGTLSALAALL